MPAERSPDKHRKNFVSSCLCGSLLFRVFCDKLDEDNYPQAGDLFRLMSEDQKQQLADNIAGGLCRATRSVHKRMIRHFTLCDPDYGMCVKAALEQLSS